MAGIMNRGTDQGGLPPSEPGAWICVFYAYAVTAPSIPHLLGAYLTQACGHNLRGAGETIKKARPYEGRASFRLMSAARQARSAKSIRTLRYPPHSPFKAFDTRLTVVDEAPVRACTST